MEMQFLGGNPTLIEMNLSVLDERTFSLVIKLPTGRKLNFIHNEGDGNIGKAYVQKLSRNPFFYLGAACLYGRKSLIHTYAFPIGIKGEETISYSSNTSYPCANRDNEIRYSRIRVIFGIERPQNNKGYCKNVRGNNYPNEMITKPIYLFYRLIAKFHKFLLRGLISNLSLATKFYSSPRRPPSIVF